ncbi:MAG: serine/threonine protein kinase [Ignavibacteria bacterium]|nr:serine/threonine protein kinase [Ignavibacteria bacterium]
MVGKTINNYYIESVIGEGGMGTVYRARHKYLDIHTAIKVLHLQYSRNPQFKERFINEAVALSKLDSPYIVKIKDFFDHEQNLFLVMEYIKGVGLDQYIRNVFGPIPEVRAVEIFRKILLGVNSAHAKSVIHRDLKPSNIILENDDTPKILDFGIAKLLDSDNKMTSPGSRMGSAIYMSPEQVLGRDLDLRTDIYSLGITLFEMLTGKNPFDLDNASEFTINSMIVNEPIPLPRSFYPHLSVGIEEVILKATAKNVYDRYNNCEEFIKSLAELDEVIPYIGYPVYSDPEPSLQTGGNSTVIIEPGPQKEVSYKTSSELLSEVQKQAALKQMMNSANRQSSYGFKKNIYILTGVFLFLVLSAIIIYYIKYGEETDLKKETIKEQPKIEKKTGQTDTIDNTVDKTSEDTKTNTEKSKVKPKKPQNKIRDYDSKPPSKRPRTTFDN